MLSMALEAAVDQNIPTAIFSLEMSNTQCVTRLIGSLLSISRDDIKEGKVEINEESLAALYKAPLYIDDTPSLSVEQFKAEATKLVKEKGVRYIFIDYLQLMTVSEVHNSISNREDEINFILRSLKAIAHDLNITIVALSQLHKIYRDKNHIQPDLQDVEALDITIPDAICLIRRPKYYTSPDARKTTTLETAELILVKNPSGDTGTIELVFNPKFCRFENK